MSIREWLLANIGVLPDGVDDGFVFVLVAKMLRARGYDHDSEELGADDEPVDSVLGLEEDSPERQDALEVCAEIKAGFVGCNAPDNMEMVIDLLADTGWDIVNEALGLDGHHDSHTNLTRGEAVGYACQHIVNLSWAYRWWKYINGEDPEFNAAFGYGDQFENSTVAKLSDTARPALDSIINKQEKNAMSVLRRLLKIAETDAWNGSSELDDALEDARTLAAGVGGHYPGTDERRTILEFCGYALCLERESEDQGGDVFVHIPRIQMMGEQAAKDYGFTDEEIEATEAYSEWYREDDDEE